MNSKAIKIVIGLLVAAIVVVGGLAVAKNMGAFSGASANPTEEESAAAGGTAAEMAITPAMTPGTGTQPDAGE